MDLQEEILLHFGLEEPANLDLQKMALLGSNFQPILWFDFQ
jgi:hypothetical protein